MSYQTILDAVRRYRCEESWLTIVPVNASPGISAMRRSTALPCLPPMDRKELQRRKVTADLRRSLASTGQTPQSVVDPITDPLVDGSCAGRKVLNSGHPTGDGMWVSMNSVIGGRCSYFKPLRTEQGNRTPHVQRGCDQQHMLVTTPFQLGDLLSITLGSQAVFLSVITDGETPSRTSRSRIRDASEMGPCVLPPLTIKRGAFFAAIAPRPSELGHQPH